MKIIINTALLIALLMNSQKVKAEGAGIGDFFDSPPAILIISGIATVFSGILYNAAANQEKECEENIKKIDKILAEFKDSFAKYCPKGREDLSDPECYCYLENGKKNTNRTKSQTCQSLWAKNDYKLLAKAGNYSDKSKYEEPKGCVAKSGAFDEQCKCRKFVDKNGANACFKASSITLPSSMGSTMLNSTGLRDVMKFADNSANGNPMLDDFKNKNLAMRAIATDNLKNKMLQDFSQASGGAKRLSEINESNIDNVAKAFFGDKLFQQAHKNALTPLAIANKSVQESISSPALKNAIKKSGVEFSGGNALNGKTTSQKETTVTVSVNNENKDPSNSTVLLNENQKIYKTNEIYKNSNRSIFEIISNRYVNSALKRLFGD